MNGPAEASTLQQQGGLMLFVVLGQLWPMSTLCVFTFSLVYPVMQHLKLFKNTKWTGAEITKQCFCQEKYNYKKNNLPMFISCFETFLDVESRDKQVKRSKYKNGSLVKVDPKQQTALGHCNVLASAGPFISSRAQTILHHICLEFLFYLPCDEW